MNKMSSSFLAKMSKISLFNYNKFNFASKESIEKLIKDSIKVSQINIQDISGGCGQAFSIQVASSDFTGKSLIQQHRLLNDILKDELAEVHSVQYKTSVASTENK